MIKFDTKSVAPGGSTSVKLKTPISTTPSFPIMVGTPQMMFFSPYSQSDI